MTRNRNSLTCLLLITSIALGDTVVLRDRTILEGEVTASGENLQVAGRSVPNSDVLLWEDDAGKLKNEPVLRDQLRAYRVIVDRQLRTRCRELITKAIEAGAGDTARALLQQGDRLGLEPNELDAFKAKIAKIDAEKKGEFDLGADQAYASFVTTRAVANGAVEESERGLQLLREALNADAENEDGLKVLDKVGPSGRAARSGSRRRRRRRRSKDQVAKMRERTRVWLNWQVDVLPSKFGRIRMLDMSHPEMERAKQLWTQRNPDTGKFESKPIFGVETSEIVFITPMERTDVVRLCVSIARFTAQSLAKMMQTEAPKRGDSDPLVIYLYANRKEYIELSGMGRGVAPNPMIAMSAGHYVPSENVSRFFWPDRAGAWESVKETFVHELTHHWIQERNPRWSRPEQPKIEDSVTTPGVWIVEGMAVFLQETRFDLDRGKWAHFNPKMMSFDSVDSIARAKNLMDWKKLFTITKVQLNTEVDAQKPMARYKGRWNLFPMGMSEMLLFYKQSGAACSYLYHAENGKYRDALLDYVTNYYTGQKDKTSIQAAFGMSEEELGKRIEEFSKKVVNGWRPK
ncbi:MAG: hypothetical protein AAGD14_07885 [Planctomycetota bacterium]